MDRTIIDLSSRIGSEPISRVYNMDCMDAMVQMPDKFIQLSCVDPPYGIGYDTQAMSGANTQYGVALGKKKDYGKSNWDEVIPDKLYFSELFRVSKHQIIWGGNYFIDHLISTKSWCFWYKRTNGQFSDGELAWTSFDIPLRVFDFLWNGMMQGDMKNKEDRIHPTQKPVALYKWLLKNYAKPGDKIFDSHMGSQSSRIAAYQMGFDYFGTELDADYFRDGCKRFDAVIHKKDTQEYEAKPEGSGTLF